MRIIFLTGTLGAGKTTLFENLLQLMLIRMMSLPRIIVNDRGETANLDYLRIKHVLPNVDATDLLGQCIGCGGREDFLGIVRDLRAKGDKLLMVEPTGLFTLGELEKIADELADCEIRCIHLVALPDVQAAVAAGMDNLERCDVIGLTKAEGDVSTAVRLLGEFTGKPVVIARERPREPELEKIWNLLNAPRAVRADHDHEHHSCGHGHDHHGCGHEHDHGDHSCGHGDHGHEHDHHHDGEPHVVTFATEGWTKAQLLGYLLALGAKLVRFKGILALNGERVLIEWAHGRFSERPASPEAELKADLFTTTEVQPPSPVNLTNEAIASLARGIPPVLVESPTGGFAKLDPVGPSAWSLLYETSQSASADMRRACGLQLVARCRKVTWELIEGDMSRFDPNLLDYIRLQTAMVWLWWNEQFGFDLNARDRQLIDRLLTQLDPERVSKTDLAPWMGEAYGYLPRLQGEFPVHASKIALVEERMAS